MIGVTQKDDKVMILLPSKRRDVLLTCGEAEKFVEALEQFADTADRGRPTLVRGERWEVGVQSYDGYVAVRFLPPSPGYVDRVPLPPAVARALAERVRFKSQQAAYRMRFEFGNSPPVNNWPNWGLGANGLPRVTDPKRRPPWRQRRVFN